MLAVRPNKYRQHNLAFTLTEMAIVVGVAGGIFAGLWIAATSVWKRHQVEKATQLVLRTAQNIRDHYQNTRNYVHPAPPYLPWAAGDYLTVDMDLYNLIPIEARQDKNLPPGDPGQTINNPLSTVDTGGTFEIQVPWDNVPLNVWKGKFLIRLTNLDNGDCIAMSQAIAIESRELGIDNVSINGDVPRTTSYSPTEAVTVCVKGNAANRIYWRFIMQPTDWKPLP